MSSVNALHDQAMANAEQAFLARRRGDTSNAAAFYLAALELERKAAHLLVDNYDAEPTRSILFRSAAALALECDDARQAEQLICKALSGSPPESIARELRNLWEAASFSHHLNATNQNVSDQTVELTLIGPSIGFGIAPARDALDRTETTEVLLTRIAEHKLGRPFRERGRPSKEIRQRFSTYLTSPRAASFAIGVRVGGSSTQKEFSYGISFDPDDVVTELLECLDLFSRHDATALHKRFDHRSYYRNFIALAAKLAPDGERITQVALCESGGEQRKVILNVPTVQFWTNRPKQKTAVVRITGEIKAADSSKQHHQFVLVDDNGGKHIIHVQEGYLADIVKPWYEERVVIIAKQLGSGEKRFERLEPIEGQ